MLTIKQVGPVKHIEIDDGKLNVFTLDLLEGLRSEIVRAAADNSVRCLVLQGNARALSVGLDTRTVLGNVSDGKRLMRMMGEVLETLYLSRLASVVIVEGHATAAGAMLLLAADFRIGVGEKGKIGLSEVTVGLSVPPPTQQLVRDRIGNALPVCRYRAR